MSEDMRVRCTCGETACESELCDCDAIPCPVNHRAEEAEAEVAHLRAERDALKAELAEAKRVASTCSCNTAYETYEGPGADCPVHGAIRALNDVTAELAEVRAAIERFRHRHRPVEPDHPTGGPLCAWCRTAHPCAELTALDTPSA